MYVRIRKQQARKLYALDVPITMVTHKMYPLTSWGLGYTVQKSDVDNREPDHFWTFDQLANNYTSYNSSYEEGYYPAYYVEQSIAYLYNIPVMEAE